MNSMAASREGWRMEDMSSLAWQVRDNARLLAGKTKVGCAVMSGTGGLWSGVNVQHQYRSHDIHAEVNAIGNMISSGRTDLVHVLIAAERERFTPCGGCLDWIFEFGGPTCKVSWQSAPNGPVSSLTAAELMPHYPS